MIDIEVAQESDWATPRNVLMQASDGEIIVTLEDREGIDTIRAARWLLSLKLQFGPCVLVGYGFNLDSNHIVSSLPRSKRVRLHRKGWVFYRDLRIEYVPRKWLRIGLIDDESRESLGQSITIEDTLGFFNASFLSFVEHWTPEVATTLGAEAKALGYPSDLALLRAGKARRPEGFRVADLPFLRAYNGLEVRWGARALKRFNDAAHDAGIWLDHFFGAGCIATYLLKTWHARDYITIPESYSRGLTPKIDSAQKEGQQLARQIRQNLNRWLNTCDDLALADFFEGTRSLRKCRSSFNELSKEAARATHPELVEHAAEQAFGGGRSELFQYGIFRERLWLADVNSQYPSILRDLPNFARGKWVPGLGHDRRLHWSFLRIRWHFPPGRRIYPFFFRDPADESISFPPNGIRWVTQAEYEAALDCGGFPSDSMEILDSWSFVPDDPSERPFHDKVSDLMVRRLAFKKVANPAHVPLKVGGNSLFGKTHQHVAFRKGERPSFFSAPIAAFITGGGRAMLYRAARSKGDASEERTVHFATDGWFSRGERPRLAESDGLGDWTVEEYAGGMFVKGGVYLLVSLECPEGARVFDSPETLERALRRDAVRLSRYGPPFLLAKARGFAERAYPWAEVFRHWADGNPSPVRAKTRPKFVGLGYAVATGRWDEWLTFKVQTRTERIDNPIVWHDSPEGPSVSAATKRVDSVPSSRWTRSDNPATRPWQTDPWDPCQGHPEESAPSIVDFRAEEEDDIESEELAPPRKRRRISNITLPGQRGSDLSRRQGLGAAAG